MKKKLFVLLMAICVAFAFTACGGGSSSEEASDDGGDDAAAAEEVVTLKVSLQPSQDNFMCENWREWAELVKEKSGGTLDFQFYYDDTLVDANAAYQQLVAGVADIGDVHRFANDGFVINESWKLLTAGIKPEQQDSLSHRLLEEFPEVADEYKDVHILAHAYSGGGSYDLLTVNKEVHTPDDIKGMTIWCEADWNEFFKACGATPVNTPFSEVYSSLQKNMYDGMFIAAETLQSCNFAEVCKYDIDVDFVYMSGPGHLMNLDKYNSLTDEQKAALDDPECVALIEDANREDGFGIQESSIQWAVDNHDVTVVELSADEKQAWLDKLQEGKSVLAKKLDDAGLPGTEMIEAIAKWGQE